MKKYSYILVFIFLLCSSIVYSQNREILGIVQIDEVNLVQPDTLEFDILLKRTSDRWDRWANGTFQLEFTDTNFKLGPSDMQIEYIFNSSDLPTPPLSGGILPVDSYIITPRILTDRISITIAGPELYPDASYVPMDDNGIKIGTFRIFSNLGQKLSESLGWKMPSDYYQACAYKLKNDTIRPINIPWAFENDNIEMDNLRSTGVTYERIDTIPPQMVLKYFHGEYVGLRKVRLWWETEREAYNKGFVLTRGIKPPFGDDDDTQFNTLIARFDDGIQWHRDSLTGLGTKRYGREYIYPFDTVPYRGEEYCYLLQYIDFNDSLRHIPYTDEYGVYHEKAIRCIPIPNAVISAAEAQPNPFREQTTVKYLLDDNVLLTVSVFDLLGKEVKRLIDKQEVELGWHEVIFNAPVEELASQGLYQIVFIANPIDDPNVEISKAIVKVQLIR